MDVVRRSAWLKVGPNDAGPNHEPGRGQIYTVICKELTSRNHAWFS